MVRSAARRVSNHAPVVAALQTPAARAPQDEAVPVNRARRPATRASPPQDVNRPSGALSFLSLFALSLSSLSFSPHACPRFTSPPWGPDGAPPGALLAFCRAREARRPRL